MFKIKLAFSLMFLLPNILEYIQKRDAPHVNMRIIINFFET